ncbi:LarC family nickel insertion protein [Methanocella conradii]|uniref:LarC family nickel insertion protein n=1 Tax=Methanocella conradii TaxID=1175444 RepID=UPI00157CC70C|nr:LarC family nickel insertion protein [Methanocella conradii]
MKCLILDPFCGATEEMLLGAMLGCGADEWRVRSIVEGLCDAPLDVQDRQDGMAAKVAGINANAARKRHPDLGRDEALSKLNVMHERQPVRSDSMGIVGSIFDAMEALYGQGQKMSVYTMALIAGICTAYDSLGRPAVHSTPAAMGGGVADVGGKLTPLPRPETLKLVEGSGLIVQGGPFDGELLTFGAAAALAYYVKSSSRYYPDNRPLAVGYGAGTLDLPVPNVLRATLCEVDDALIMDRMELLETNVDDVTGEVLGSLFESLMEMGAMDVSIIPATMKKGRSGHIIRVIAKTEDGPAIARRMMYETGSLGVRVMPVKHRFIARREVVVVSVSIDGKPYDMRFKVSSDTAGRIIDVSVEYEDARLVAREIAMPLKTVMRKAEAEAWKKFGG